MFKKRWLNLILAVVMVVTAVFFNVGCSPKTFTVTFVGGAEDAVLDGENEVQEVQTVTNSNQIKEPVYIRDGYNFVGWDRSISMINGDATVKAQWNKYQFQVVFQGNGGKTQDNQEEVVLVVGSAFELKQKQPLFINKGFELSWDKSLGAITSSCTVNAVWTSKIYNLEFLDKDGLPFSNNVMQVTYNQVIEQIDVTPPTVTGKRFAYWSEGDYEGALSLDKGVLWREDRDATFYANYVDENEFIITYDLGGGEIGKRVYSYSANTSQNTPVVFDAQREGYTFEGWIIGDSQTPKLSQDITIEDFKVNGEYTDVTLKACWGNRPYAITYDTQGGALIGEDSKLVNYNQAVGTLPIAQKDGYEFVGWYYEGKIIAEQDIWKYPKDVTLTAKYLAKIKIKFSLTTIIPIDEKTVQCKVVNYGSLTQNVDLETVEFSIVEGQSLYTALSLTKLPTVAPIEQSGKTEYEFGGYWKWLDSSNNEVVVDATTVFSLDIFSGIQGGGTITLVPHCRKVWSPNA